MYYPKGAVRERVRSVRLQWHQSAMFSLAIRYYSSYFLTLPTMQIFTQSVSESRNVLFMAYFFNMLISIYEPLLRDVSRNRGSRIIIKVVWTRLPQVFSGLKVSIQYISRSQARNPTKADSVGHSGSGFSAQPLFCGDLLSLQCTFCVGVALQTNQVHVAAISRSFKVISL